MANLAMICVLAMAIGVYTFTKHLKAFSNKTKTPAKDAWLLMVGVLGWSFFLHYAIVRDETSLYSMAVVWLIYWIGDNLKIQRHCVNLLKRRLKRVKQ